MSLIPSICLREQHGKHWKTYRKLPHKKKKHVNMYINHYEPHGFLRLFQPIQWPMMGAGPNSGDPAEVTAGRALRHGHVAAIRGRFWRICLIQFTHTYIIYKYSIYICIGIKYNYFNYTHIYICHPSMSSSYIDIHEGIEVNFRNFKWPSWKAHWTIWYDLVTCHISEGYSTVDCRCTSGWISEPWPNAKGPMHAGPTLCW